MRQFGLLLVISLVVVACRDNDVTNPGRPALAGVRYINALPDTFDVDIRMIDQIDWSATANKLAFRASTEYFPVEAKTRHIRIFPQPGVDPVNGSDPAVVSQVLLDTTITFEANKKYTLLLTGSSRANTEHFVLIDDDVPDPGADNVLVRAVNAGVAGNVDAYVVPTATTAPNGTPTLGNVAPLTASGTNSRPAGSFAVRITDAGTTTVIGSAAAPDGAPGSSLQNPLAGATVGGTALSAYVFPRSVLGSRAPQGTAFQSPGVVFFVDRLPPLTAVSQ
ncbi:MAG: DUF4397 domain-containing protein [Gemmatimonadaceae bacterium]